MTDLPAQTPPPDAPPPRRRFQFRKPTRRTVFRTISYAVFCLLIKFVIVGIWAYRSAVGRFEVRRLRLPTRIYADYMPLTAGVPLQLDDLLEKLDRLGYREVDPVAQAGEYARTADGADIFTRAFRHPTGEYPSQRVHVVITKSQIDSVSVEKAALEPELLTSLLSEGLENRSPVTLDARYSKREILEAYLNDIYLGRNRSISILGVGEASRFYFGKPVSEVTIAEAALLGGMIRSPNNYSPFANPEAAMRRRNTVLQLMLKEKKITQQQFDEARSAKLPVKPFRQKTGLGSIPFYVDRVLQELATDYGIKDVKGRGLRIYTAIDLGAQDAAAQTVEQSLRNLEKSSRRLRSHSPELEAALIHVDVPTGEIRALVGGRNYERSQFNRALKSKRLIGSLFKPFIYLTAFEPSLSGKNITPATVVSDTRFVLKRRWSADWSPRNYDRYMGNVTVKMALEQSLNSASVRIGLDVGIANILKTAKVLGVDSEMDDSNPSILLGAVGIPPIEMAEAYSTIARQGMRKPLRAIRFGFDDNDPTGLAGADGAVPMWTRYMLTATAGQPNTDFAVPSGMTFADIDDISGGLGTQYCPPNVIERSAFKSGTEPTQLCTLHTMPNVVVPMYDEFGNLITTTDTTGTYTTTDTTSTYVPPPQPPAPTTDTTLTGGIFKTDTTNTTTSEPPPVQTDTTATKPP